MVLFLEKLLEIPSKLYNWGGAGSKISAER